MDNQALAILAAVTLFGAIAIGLIVSTDTNIQHESPGRMSSVSASYDGSTSN